MFLIILLKKLKHSNHQLNSKFTLTKSIKFLTMEVNQDQISSVSTFSRCLRTLATSITTSLAIRKEKFNPLNDDPTYLQIKRSLATTKQEQSILFRTPSENSQLITERTLFTMPTRYPHISSNSRTRLQTRNPQKRELHPRLSHPFFKVLTKIWLVM